MNEIAENCCTLRQTRSWSSWRPPLMKSLLNSPGFGITGSSGWKTLERLLLQQLKILKLCRSLSVHIVLDSTVTWSKIVSSQKRKQIEKKDFLICGASFCFLGGIFWAGKRPWQQSFHLADWNIECSFNTASLFFCFFFKEFISSCWTAWDYIININSVYITLKKYLKHPSFLYFCLYFMWMFSGSEL